MPAHRRSQSGALRPEAVAKVVLIVAVIALVSIGYVRKKNELLVLSREITKREAQLDQLVRQNRWLLIEVENGLLPQNLAESVRRLQLGLVPVHQTQWVRLLEPGEPWPVPVAGAHLLVNK